MQDIEGVGEGLQTDFFAAEPPVVVQAQQGFGQNRISMIQLFRGRY